jgi:hypothetical protein
MPELKSRTEADSAATPTDRPALIAPPHQVPASSSQRRAGLSLSGWMSDLLDQLNDDELPRS